MSKVVFIENGSIFSGVVDPNEKVLLIYVYVTQTYNQVFIKRIRPLSTAVCSLSEIEKICQLNTNQICKLSFILFSI